MLTTALLIGLSVVATLCLWNSYILSPIKEQVGKWVGQTNYPYLIYFYDCDQCKALWLCIVCALVVGNIILTIPAYGVAVIGLGITRREDD